MRKWIGIVVMACLVGVPLAFGDYVGGELRRAFFEKLGSDPSSNEARFYYNTVGDRPKFYDGVSWLWLGTNPGTTRGDVFYCSATATPCVLARLPIGAAGTVLHGSATDPSYSAVSLTVDVSGILPRANGGTAVSSTATFPTSGVIVTEDATQTLTNKTLQGAFLSLQDPLSSQRVNVTLAGTYTGQRTLNLNLRDANRTFDFAGDLTLAAAFTTSGANALTLTTTGSTNVTLPTTGTVTVTANKLSVFAATSSAELAGVLSDESGSGLVAYTTSPALTTPTIVTAETLLAQAETRWNDADNTNYVGLRSPAAVAANRVWMLPIADGTTGQVLKTDGALQLGWVSPLTNPMTTTGDIIYSSDGSGTATRLAIGATGTVLHGGTIPSYSQIVNADVDAAAAIAGSKLVAATGSVAGAVTTAAQTFAGEKTFSNGINRTDVAISAYDATDQALTETGISTLDFATESTDLTASFASDTFTAPVAGTYRIAISGSTVKSSGTATPGDQFLLRIVKNGTSIGYNTSWSAGPTTADSSYIATSINAILTLAASDTIIGRITPSIGGGRTFTGNLRGFVMTIDRL